MSHEQHQLNGDEVHFIEMVWGRCKLCKKAIEEMRVFDDESSCNLKKVISSYDHIPTAPTLGQGCQMFENHLKTHCSS